MTSRPGHSSEETRQSSQASTLDFMPITATLGNKASRLFSGSVYNRALCYVLYLISKALEAGTTSAEHQPIAAA